MSTAREIFKRVLKSDFKILDGLQVEFVKELGAGGEGRVLHLKINDGVSNEITNPHFALKVFEEKKGRSVASEIKKSTAVDH